MLFNSFSVNQHFAALINDFSAYLTIMGDIFMNLNKKELYECIIFFVINWWNN